MRLEFLSISAILLLILLTILYFMFISDNVIGRIKNDYSAKILSTSESVMRQFSNIEEAQSIIKHNIIGRYKEAENLLTAIIERYGNNSPALLHNIRGNLRFTRGNYKGAQEDFIAASEKDPKNSEYFFNIAQCKLVTCDYSGAISIMENYVKRFNSDAEGHYNLAVLYHRRAEKGDISKAEKEYHRVIGSGDNYDEKAFFNLGVLYSKKFGDTRNASYFYDALNNLDFSINKSINHRSMNKSSVLARLCAIKNGLIKKDKVVCAGDYRTEDLTNLVREPKFASEFNDWFAEKIPSNMEKLECLEKSSAS